MSSSTRRGRSRQAPEASAGISDLPPAGVYVIEVHLVQGLQIAVGSLGLVTFEPGPYLYVGSALRGLPARIARHARENKPLRWHIDRLTVRGTVRRALIWSPDKRLECEIAGALGRRLPVVAGFGSSDCRCRGHLFRGAWEAVARELGELPEPLAQRGE